MATRNLGSLTTADLGRAFEADGVRGSLVAVRHFRIETGSYTSALVKVADRGVTHREVCKDPSFTAEVT